MTKGIKNRVIRNNHSAVADQYKWRVAIVIIKVDNNNINNTVRVIVINNPKDYMWLGWWLMSRVRRYYWLTICIC